MRRSPPARSIVAGSRSLEGAPPQDNAGRLADAAEHDSIESCAQKKPGRPRAKKATSSSLTWAESSWNESIRFRSYSAYLGMDEIKLRVQHAPLAEYE
jgi:hypothetical protein